MTNNLYDIRVTRSNGEEISLKSYQGNALLIVNVASACGFTPQYSGLESLYKKYQSQGLSILGFPCNDFGAQEPGTMEEIQNFCTVNFGVTFDLFQKVHAKGPDQHPLYGFLTTHAEPAGDVRWNFEKFLISKQGEILARYDSGVTPEDSGFIRSIERALA